MSISLSSDGDGLSEDINGNRDTPVSPSSKPLEEVTRRAKFDYRGWLSILLLYYKAFGEIFE